MGNQTFIEINGKKYDAVTGKMVGDPTLTPQKTVIQPQPKVGVMDGFTRRPLQKKRTQQSQIVKAAKPMQKSQTLVRTAVKKPQPTLKQPTPLHKPSLKPPAHRVARAQEVQKSPQVNKYDHSHIARSSVVKRTGDLAVQPLPQQNKIVTNALIQNAHHQQAHSQTSSAMIEAALQNAHSHEAVHHHTKKRRKSLAKRLGVSTKAATLSTAVLAGVLLGGFFAVQNVPNLSMRVAATRAGFAAEMPAYQPAGFSFTGPINYKPGQVIVSFKSNTDTRNYQVTQTSSNWNSDALLANFISNEKKQYQTYLDKGRTLYIYDGSNATWVDNGVWYQIEGDSDLTTDQLIRIASSI